ncbi:MAG: Prolyl-tRNA synthetase [Parcubacteria group bacterium GW2011_GWA2_42_11]|nr:MAG: Prolyl-tRNA synthetase [Parcubacteria group bacterium GW2011_GWA2_42_11]KKT76443.1 MAG: Prolyl-tRNA synthetase [Parcubacteria group bacterium GW2011_GWF2_44_7]
MKQSQLANKILREAPSDEQSANAKLLARAGFIDKLGAGIYSYLPLGLRVLKKIENIVREEMMKAGGQEILMPVLHPKDNWQQTGRWDGLDVLFKLKGLDEKEYALGATHEEIVSPLAKKLVLSYKDLPLYLFQIQTKFRNEPRAKSGLLRGREFLMKDLYSFHANQADLDEYYEKMIDVYFDVFARCGLEDATYLTLASGGTFAKYSHEFQTVSEAGEDTIHICQHCDLAINQEIKDETPACPDCGNSDFKTAKAIEVGNIFKLGTKYAAPFDLKFRDDQGQEQTVIMGCYGIGPSRVMGTIVEIFHDDKGIIWPENVAPFKCHLLALGEDDKIKKAAEEIYSDLQSAGVEVLYDDRDLSAGAKFAEADLIGIPYRLVISAKTLAEKSVELKKRNEEKTEMIKINNIAGRLAS